MGGIQAQLIQDSVIMDKGHFRQLRCVCGGYFGEEYLGGRLILLDWCTLRSRGMLRLVK